MQLPLPQVVNLAKLAKLAIKPKELIDYQQDLSQIISLVEQMQAVDTTNIEPLSHPFDLTQRLRNDEITESNQRNILQQNSKNVDDGLFTVPKVIA